MTEGVGTRELRSLSGEADWGGLWSRPLALALPEGEDDRGSRVKLCKVLPVLSNWKDAWLSLVPDRQELGKMESTVVRELDRTGLEQGRLDFV